MKPQLNDEEIIQDYLNTNSGDCFETLYNRYVNKVYKRCLSLTKDSEKAQDFTHDIFIKMFARLDGFQGRSTFSTWLYSISYNYCIDQLQATKRSATSSLDETINYSTARTEDDDAHEDSLLHLTNVMNALSTQEARLLRLKYQDELEIKQIAQLMNLNDSAVKMRLKRARDKVRRLYLDTVC